MKMKRLFRILAVCLVCGTMVVPQFEMSAQGRRPGANQRTENGNKHGGNNHNNGGSRPNNGNNNHQRPNQGNNNHQRPNQGGNNNHQRPNQGNNNQQRPNQGGNNNHQRPNQGNNTPQRPNFGKPVTNPKPHPAPGRPVVGNNHHSPNPGHHGVRPTPPRPPHRPHRPNMFWSHRPAPPPSFRPHYRLTPLQAILGFAVGTAFNASLNYLYANNYNVDGYDNNQLFLRNVNAYNTVWPDVVLNYANGVLVTSNFSYSTPYYDSTCYNRVFGVLSNTYGAPVSTSRQNNGWSATWWGYDNRYLTLDFRPYYAVDGSLRYYTTLTVG